jgi:N-acetylglutamate synthase-like GNAT family acetyltransferase
MTGHQLRSPQSHEEWQQYHAIRRRVLWENRGQYGVYDDKHPDESKPGRYPMVLVREGQAIGVIRIDIEGRQAIFRRVAIRDDIQRSGHGRVMLKLSEDFALRHGCDHLYSFVAPDAVGFYEKCGFQRDLSRAEIPDHVPMRKNL